MAKETAKTLSEVAHTRLRTEYLMGSRELHTQKVVGFDGKTFAVREYTWVPALWTAFREIVDNALDELVAHQYGDTLTVDYDPDKFIISVHDNGRGVPVHEIPDVGKGPAASIMLSNTRSGRNFEADRGETAGMNGLGAAIVNMTSEWFEIEIDRDGTQDYIGAKKINQGPKKLTQRWTEGVKDGKDIRKTSGPHVIRGNKNRSGTLVRFKPSPQVFKKMVLPEAFIRERMWDLAVINPKIKIIYNGERLQPASGVDPIKNTFFANLPVAVIPVETKDFKSVFYVVANFDTSSEYAHSHVNNIPTIDGGKHLNMFRNLFYEVACEEIEKQAKRIEKGAVVERAQVSQGMLIWNITRMKAPTFDSQTKTRLISDVGGMVKEGFHQSDVKSFLRRNPEWVKSVIDRVLQKVKKKSDSETKKKENALLKQRVARLVDASGRVPADRILFLFEGDSAQGKFPEARNPQTHGYLPLLGKPSNAWDMSLDKIVEDKVYNQIMTALGLKVTEEFSMRRLRYGRIFIATDEDEDGKNIASLLTAFFYRCWPEMFREKNPILYRFKTPFISLKKGSDLKYIYAEDYEEYRANPGKYKGWTADRKKGLGALETEEWEHALKNPNLIPLTDDGKLEETLDKIFNQNRADDRKEWLRKG